MDKTFYNDGKPNVKLAGGLRKQARRAEQNRVERHTWSREGTRLLRYYQKIAKHTGAGSAVSPFHGECFEG